ncbi:hypothetical protein HanPI659440_Chr06g0231991 [Helianthus annuus]|nr:hypothetical protein HanPI659440_Chr06g0231991 [Helianthus annuus]
MIYMENIKDSSGTTYIFSGNCGMQHRFCGFNMFSYSNLARTTIQNVQDILRILNILYFNNGAFPFCFHNPVSLQTHVIQTGVG